MARILNVLLDLAFFPARSRIAELGLEHVMADHRRKPRVDGPDLAASDLVDRRTHIVVDPAPRHAAQHTERMIVRVKQHLMRLKDIGAYEERTAVTELEVRDLKLGTNTVYDRPVLAPIELERLARRKRERHKSAASARLLLDAVLVLPGPCKRRHTAIRAVIPKAHQIGMQLLDRALLLARPRHLPPQPCRQPVSVRIQLARPVRRPETRLNHLGSQVLA